MNTLGNVYWMFYGETRRTNQKTHEGKSIVNINNENSRLRFIYFCNLHYKDDNFRGKDSKK